MTVQPSVLFIAGLGYSATHLARIWPGPVAGTVRSEAKAEALRARGIDARVWAGESPLEVPAGAALLVTIPPDEAGCPVLRHVHTGPGHDYSGPDHDHTGLSHDLAVTYLSTTGVYGDLGGGWAFEWSETHPQSRRAKARVLAEEQWRAATGGRASLVRLPGIYGPGRSAFDRLREGTARRIVKPGQVFSRVHVDDIASGLLALHQRPEAAARAGGVFHLCDDEPAPSQDVIAHAAKLLGMDPLPDVPFDEAGLSPMARSFYAECKRISNARTKAALSWRPQYPTYREGLAAILAGEG
ncbi:SDR family NAD(P)-dependent oxidoreductase [Hyphomonas jannaschiana]|uniref:SDR family NAD(P)-dependent oxidoreductase n=1 Tax=Hyphomonas jannaschiana TaxID=86 RepID=UPI0035C7056C